MATERTSPKGGESFAALLRGFRVAAALSQEALAERAGLSTRAISNMERGISQRPYLETVRLLADALGIDAGERAQLSAAARPRPASDQSVGAEPSSQPKPRPMLPIPRTRLIG